MRMSASKSEEKRLDRAVRTFADQTESRLIPAAETRNHAQLEHQMPRHRHSVTKRLDLRPKQRHRAGDRILLGECWFSRYISNLGSI